MERRALYHRTVLVPWSKFLKGRVGVDSSVESRISRSLKTLRIAARAVTVGSQTQLKCL